MKRLLCFLALFLIAALPVTGADRPNILMIAVDDLNDWIGVLGGHPQAKTPGMDRLASKGVLFSNAHCQSPVCNPSRASLMTSLYPETSGIYFLNPPIVKSEVASKVTVMPERFVQEGYSVAAAGKLFHHTETAKYFKDYAGSYGGFGPYPKKKLVPSPYVKLWDWGTFPEKTEMMPDYKIASWAEDRLTRKYDKPFFIAAGFYTPHVPQYAPQKWQDLYPNKSLKLPEVRKDDLADLSKYAISLTRDKHIAPTHEWVLENKEWEALVKTYLACVSLVDAQVDRVVKAVEASPYANNTYIVLFSDHGFHLGEKERWAKRTIWKDSTRVPFMIAGPGIKPGVCEKPVELIDIYPTLLDLTGCDPDPAHEGQSLRPLLEDPGAEWPHMARSSFGPRNVAIISEDYRYIRYADGSEEFYDSKKDPHEWDNVIGDKEYEKQIKAHRKEMPKTYADVLGQRSTGHKAFDAAGEVAALTPAVQNAVWAQSFWMPRHETKLKAAEEQEKIDLLFIGDSITQQWEKKASDVWEEFYGKRNAFNIGFSGDRTENVLWRLENGALENMDPKVAVLLIGTNNAGHRKEKPEITANGVKAILESLKKRQPDTKVLMLAIYPRGQEPDHPLRKINDATNELIKEFADGEMIHFLNLNSHFMQEDGSLKPGIMPDKLHLNKAGYRIWAESMEPQLKALLGE